MVNLARVNGNHRMLGDGADMGSQTTEPVLVASAIIGGELFWFAGNLRDPLQPPESKEFGAGNLIGKKLENRLREQFKR